MKPDTITPKGSQIGIVYGNDHHSFPSAIRKIISKGIHEIFHAVRSPLHSECCWNYMDLRQEVNLSHLDDRDTWPQFVHKRSQHLMTDKGVFTTFGADLLKEIASHPLDLVVSKIETLFTTEFILNQRLAFVPYWIPIAVELTDSGTCQVLEIENKVRMNRTIVTNEPTSHWVVSPGHCRQHTFCIYDRNREELSWHRCN